MRVVEIFLSYFLKYFSSRVQLIRFVGVPSRKNERVEREES